MPFLSPLKIKNKLQKKKQLGRVKNGADMKAPLMTQSSAEDSQRTFQSVSEMSTSRGSPSPSRGASSESKHTGVALATDYGYGDAAPDISARNKASYSTDAYGCEVHTPSGPGATPRRSSMKGSNSEPRPTRRRHSISFQDEVKVNKVVPMTELVKDKGDMWLQGEDYYKIIHKVNSIVDRTTTGKGPYYCTRGLEHLIREKEGMENGPRTKAWDAVLDEQQMQQATGTFDDERVSRKYRRYSNQSRVEAKLRAKKDENEVSKYLEDTRRYCRRMSM